LKDIEILKQKRDAGETLDPFQIEKIENESKFREEIQEIERIINSNANQ